MVSSQIKKGEKQLLVETPIKENLLPNEIDNSWLNILTSDFINELQSIYATIKDESYYPSNEVVMRFMKMNLSDVKCIILGMDPYPSDYMNEHNEKVSVATGRSFEVDNLNNWNQKFKQASLRNIVKAIYLQENGEDKSFADIREEINNGKFHISQPHEWFDNMEKQGVMFLNATLTVKAGKPDSHTKLWENIMNDIIRYIDNNATVKWLILGNKAKERITRVLGLKDNMVFGCHPRMTSFVNENIFSRIQEINFYC